VRLPPAPDRVEQLSRVLADAAASCDLILTSGGVSVGDFDRVRDVLGGAGKIDFWQVAVKPGKPLAYGRLHGRPLLGLPGNPVSSFVCFELFGRPAVRKLAGQRSLLRPVVQALLAAGVRRNANRREFLRGRLLRRDGALWAEPLARQGSSDLSSLIGADLLIDVAAGAGTLKAGESIEALLLNSECAALSPSAQQAPPTHTI